MQVLDAVNAKTGTRERVAVSGPQFLGLSDPIVSEASRDWTNEARTGRAGLQLL